MVLFAALLVAAALAAAEPDPPLPAADRVQAQALAYAQSQAAGREGTYTFTVVNPPVLPKAGRGELRFEPAHLSRADLAGRFYVTFNVLAEGRTVGMVRVDLDGRWSGRLQRFRTALARKAVPAPGQLEAFDFEGTPAPGALAELPAGFRLRGPVAAGHILVRTDLEAIPLVCIGDPVRVELVDGDLSVTVDATARSAGAAGEKVRLEMPSSHRMLQAVVTGPGAARVAWGGAK